MTYRNYISRRKLVYGIGINNANYSVSKRENGKQVLCPYYRAWNSMLCRCYSEAYHKSFPSYSGCSVSKQWLHFMNFRLWMNGQDWKGKVIDKDILYPGNKIYSPSTCIFVPQSLNKLLTNNKTKNRGLPQGVSRSKKSKGLLATIRVNNTHKYLGTFSNPEEAHAAYCDAKRIALITRACCEPDIRIKQGLYRHSLLY